MKTIEITVSPNGESQVETKGFIGEGCQQASRFIELAIGKAVSEKLKPEFHEQYISNNSVENSS